MVCFTCIGASSVAVGLLTTMNVKHTIQIQPMQLSSWWWTHGIRNMQKTWKI